MSGGRTSAYMTYRLLNEYSDKYEIIVCFANLFESWSSKDRKSWQRMKKYFPELTKEFDKMMDVYADPSTIFKKVT